MNILIVCAACEALASLLRCGTPLTRDMIGMGQTTVVADPGRNKRELAPALIYPLSEKG